MKQYYECHITLEKSDTQSFDYIETFVKSIKWKFSCINGDPVLGPGVKCYATKHFNIKLFEEDVLEKLLEASDHLKKLGIKVTRRKIEKVVFDDRIKKLFACNGGCIECHVDDLQ